MRKRPPPFVEKRDSMDSKTIILQMTDLTLSFPGVRALESVSLDIHAGEVHVLVGENGAGKSSLVKVLCGIYQPDSGRILYDGREYAPQGPLDALRSGIRIVYQEFNLLSYLSIAENVFFERLPRRRGLVNFKKLYSDTEAILARVGLEASPRTRVEMLGVAQMQLLEIAKAISTESRVLVLDEPTATLTSKEIERLFGIIRRLKEDGVTIIYISHRLQEIFSIGDRITVLRNGTRIGTMSVGDVTIPKIVAMMVGRDMEAEYPFRADVVPGEMIFEVRGLRFHGSRHGVSFGLRRGEILGIAGLVGSGRTETVRAIFGADRRDAGEILVDGQPVTVDDPKDAVGHGICLMTEDRKSQGLILDMSCAANITLTDLDRVSRMGLLRKGHEMHAAEALIHELSIKTPTAHQWVRYLSGGNQQKLVLAKWLFRNARILILDEPTRGIDVGAKYEIYLLLWKLAEAGKGIIIVSSDLPELLGICHGILVFSNGKITGEFERREFDQEKILSAAYQEYLAPHVAP